METTLTTTISGVTVYTDRALVTRHATAHLDDAGTHTLRIGGLPAGVQRDSLRATGRGPAGMRILGVEQASEYHPAAPEETLRALEDDIARLEREEALLEQRQKTVEQERGWLQGLGEQSARSLAWGMARGTAKPDDANAFFEFVADQSQRLAASSIDVGADRDKVRRELDARRRERDRLGGHTRPDRLAALVSIELTTPGQIEIELTYLISGAWWRPRYDARVDVAGSRVHLTQQALVSQRTGEEWAQVALALSTARPSAAASLPDEPDPWYVGAAQPAPAAAVHRLAMSAPRAAGRLDESVAYSVTAPAPEPPVMFAPAAMSVAETERSGAAQVFHVPGGVDVPSDGSPHTLGLGEYELPCRLDYVALPVVTEGAHLRASAPNASGRVLLPGELHVFHAGSAGDEYIGATRLELTAQDADLKLYLGVDDNLTVKRELIERDTDRGSLLQRGVRMITFGYRITVGNRTGAVQRVVVKDRLPVPRHERIKVRVLDLKPQPTSRTRLDQLSWELSLAPNEERQIEWRFVVEAPADLDVSGLP